MGLLAGGVVTLVLLAWKCVFRIEQGHIGVLTSHGRAVMKDESKQLLKIWEPGLHFKWPWERVASVSMMEQILDLSGQDGGISAMASDGTILRLDSKLRFAPVEYELYDFLFGLRNPVEHIKGLFTCLLRNEIANFKAPSAPGAEEPLATGSYSEIRSQRRLLNHRIEEFTRQKIAGRYGVRFDAVDLNDILPPDELAEALNAVFNAQTEANISYARAEAECRSRTMAAKRGLTIAKERAEATKKEILTIARFLKELDARGMLKSYIERRRAETAFESRTVYLRRST